VLRECVAIREKTQPDAWTTFNTQSMLGGALLGQAGHQRVPPAGVGERRLEFPKALPADLQQVRVGPAQARRLVGVRGRRADGGGHLEEGHPPPSPHQAGDPVQLFDLGVADRG